MQFYHTTNHADAILAEGFRDATGPYMTARLWTGVWLADRPVDANEGVIGDTVLVLEIPEAVVKPYEWVEEGKPYREFLVPAEIVNRYEPPRVLEYWPWNRGV